MEIKDWIRAARSKAELTQTELGERLGVTKGNVSGWENGRHEPSYTQMLKLAELTKWSVPLPGMAPKAAWPFASVQESDVAALPALGRAQLDGALALAIAQLKLDVPVREPAVDAPIRREQPGDRLPIGSPANDEYAEVHRFDVKFAGGSGRISFFEDEKAKLAFRVDFLKSIGVKLKNAMIVYLQGDSHDPIIPSGSALLVDRGVTEMHTLENGGKGFFYAFWWAGGLAVKRLVCQEDGAIMAYSCNPAPEFAPFQINNDTFKIIGRVKWMGTRL